MSGQSHRIKGGRIDRSTSLAFRFDHKTYHGFGGDTLASSLIANGVKLVGRSFKYHRPRGIFSSGPEEPNALVELGSGAHLEPNSRATVIELFDGLAARSQNYRGSLKRDWMALNDLIAPLLSAGFYYKTFMWPQSFWEKFYEPAIRAAAGLGSLSLEEDPDRYDKGFLHGDLLVIGSGPSGLAAALEAGRAGLSVILADEDFILGGRLNAENAVIDDQPGHDWAASVEAELAAMPHVRIMKRTTVYGAFDHGVYGALERMTDHRPHAGLGKPRQVLWRLYAKAAILAAGATERSIAFNKNDRPGIMLAGAVRGYANRFAAAAGKEIAVFTNNDDGWRTARDMAAHGIEVAAIIDTRSETTQTAPKDTRMVQNGRIIDTNGRHGIHSFALPDGTVLRCDCLAVSGGWNPNVHLTCHQRGRPVWDDRIAAFVPGDQLPHGMRVVGAARGLFGTGEALQDGFNQARAVAEELGRTPALAEPPRASDDAYAIEPFWYVTPDTGRAWVDLQNDVTTKDIKLSNQEGFRSVEHMKRYTTLGMATDQGKTSNVLGLAIMADITGQSIQQTGTTIFRPPYTPVPIGAFAGRARGKDFRPVRHTPSHDWAAENGAVFVETGMWLRAQWFARQGETHWRQSVDREVTQTRSSAGICDVTTLGKIDIQGRDATTFINSVYANPFAKLAVGKVRYGLMLREDGMVMDDGTTARLGEQHYVMTTTTANAVGVFRHLEFCRQCLWPSLDVHLISITEQWAQFAVAGPNARKILAKLVDAPFDITNEAFAFMACAELTVCGGVQARLFRISFSGELAYEIAVPASYGDGMIRALMAAGDEFDAVPYGTEALGVMRIEKGHPAGNELDGRTTAKDLGMERMVSTKKDFVGSVLRQRPELARDDRPRLVGFKPVDHAQSLAAGAHFIGHGDPADTEHDQGWMSSVAFSPTLGHSIGLGFIDNGAARIGETVRAVDLLRDSEVEVEIASPHFVDPEGVRLRD